MLMKKIELDELELLPERKAPGGRPIDTINALVERLNRELAKPGREWLPRFALPEVPDSAGRGRLRLMQSEPIEALDGFALCWTMRELKLGRSAPYFHVEGMIAALEARAARCLQSAGGLHELRSRACALAANSSTSLAPAELKDFALDLGCERGSNASASLRFLGDDFTERTSPVDLDARDHFAHLRRSLRAHRRRSAALASAIAHDAIGFVDAVTLAALTRLRITPLQAAALLRSQQQLRFRSRGSGGGRVHGTLRWIDGSIVARLHDRRRGITVSPTKLSLPQGFLPETLLASMVGRNISDLVDYRHLPDRAVVTSAETKNDRIVIRLVTATYAIGKPAKASSEARRRHT